MNIEFRKHLESKILENPKLFELRILKLFESTLFTIESYYIEETPVATSNLRKSVTTKNEGLKGVVTTTASYANIVHSGQGKYKGGVDGGYTNTNKNYTSEDLKKFKAMRKMGVKFNIKPNKFANRTYNKTKEIAPDYFIKNLLKIIHD